MVFEELFKSDFLQRRPWYTFIIGFCFAIIAAGCGLLIFKSNPGYMIVAFIAILTIPTLSRLLVSYEQKTVRANKFNIFRMIADHLDVFEVYFFLFLGIFTATLVISLFLPEAAIVKLYQPQMAVAGITGKAINPEFFSSVLSNNIVVFVVCILLSIAYGAGSFLFLAWNAVTWGAIFGYFLKSNFALIVPALPHLFTETAAYVGAAIVGGVLSKALITEKLFSKRFFSVVTDSLIFLFIFFLILVLAAYLEASVGLA